MAASTKTRKLQEQALSRYERDSAMTVPIDARALKAISTFKMVRRDGLVSGENLETFGY
jgi:hypothetical protein